MGTIFKSAVEFIPLLLMAIVVATVLFVFANAWTSEGPVKPQQVYADPENYTQIALKTYVHTIQDQESGARFFVVTSPNGVAIHLIPEPDNDDQPNMMASQKRN